MAKTVKQFEFNTKARIKFDERWLNGEIWALTEKDVGGYPPSGAKGRLQALRHYVRGYDSKDCRLQVADDGVTIMLQCFDVAKAAE